VVWSFLEVRGFFAFIKLINIILRAPNHPAFSGTVISS